MQLLSQLWWPNSPLATPRGGERQDQAGDMPASEVRPASPALAGADVPQDAAEWDIRDESRARLLAPFPQWVV